MPRIGLEPTHLTAQDPKSCVSANFTTWACILLLFNYTYDILSFQMKNASVSTVFTKDKTKILLIERRDVPVWVLPGGGIDDDEDPHDACIREVYEETGLHVSLIRKVAEYSPSNTLHAVTHLFECFVEEETELQPQKESRRVAFFPLNDLPKTFFPLHNEWLEDALSNNPQIITKQISLSWMTAISYFFKHPILVLRYILARLKIPINSK